MPRNVDKRINIFLLLVPNQLFPNKKNLSGHVSFSSIEIYSRTTLFRDLES